MQEIYTYIQPINTFLLSTVPGAIILSAISVHFLFIISRLLKLITTSWAPQIGKICRRCFPVIDAYQKWTHDRGFKEGHAFGFYLGSDNHTATLTMMIYKCTKSLIFLILSCALLFLFIRVFASDNQILSWGSYFIILGSMICAFIAKNEYDEIYYINDYFRSLVPDVNVEDNEDDGEGESND